MVACIIGCLLLGLLYILGQLQLVKRVEESERAVILSMVDAKVFAWLLLGNKRFFDGGQPTAFIKAVLLVLGTWVIALGLGLVFENGTALLCRILTVLPSLWYLLMGLFEWARPYTTLRTHQMMGLIDW
jgi:hypothetical protein